MPRPIHKRKRETLEDQGWQRSRKGNLWQRIGAINVTIFEQDGVFKWCIFTDRAHFSNGGFESEETAARYALKELPEFEVAR